MQERTRRAAISSLAACSSRSKAAKAPARPPISAFSRRRSRAWAARCFACASRAARRSASSCGPWCSIPETMPCPTNASSWCIWRRARRSCRRSSNRRSKEAPWFCAIGSRIPRWRTRGTAAASIATWCGAPTISSARESVPTAPFSWCLLRRAPAWLAPPPKGRIAWKPPAMRSTSA